MKKIIAICTIIIAITLISGCSFGGTTTSVTTAVTTVDTDNVIDISTPTQLRAIEMNKSYRLVADIDLTGIEWTPLGSYEEPYLGIFDGNNHTISNLTITVRNDLFNGMFAHMAGTVKDLALTNFSIDYDCNYLTYAGGLSGYLTGDVENLELNGAINISNTKSNTFVGLMTGLSSAKITDTMTADQFVANQITNVTASGSIDASTKNFMFAGGLIGKTYNSEVSNCVVDIAMDVSSQTYIVYAGGLTGHHYAGILIGFEEYVTSVDIPIQNNIVTGSLDVTSAGTHASVGGFVGYTQYGIMNDNFAIVDVTVAGADLYVSAFAGEAWKSTIENVLGAGSIVIASMDEQVKQISSLVGFISVDSTVSTSYYLVETSETLVAPLGTLATLTNLVDDLWYDTWMTWDDSVYALTDIALLFTE